FGFVLNYAFQVAEYSKHFTCFSLDLRGTGETDKPDGAYSTEHLADDAAAFLQAIGVSKAHIAGLSLGGAIGLWLAAKYPDKVQSLLVPIEGSKTEPFVKVVMQGFQILAKLLQSAPEMTIREGIGLQPSARHQQRLNLVWIFGCQPQ